MKKILLGLGTLTSTLLSLSIVLSCGDQNPKNNKDDENNSVNHTTLNSNTSKTTTSTEHIQSITTIKSQNSVDTTIKDSYKNSNNKVVVAGKLSSQTKTGSPSNIQSHSSGKLVNGTLVTSTNVVVSNKN